MKTCETCKWWEGNEHVTHSLCGRDVYSEGRRRGCAMRTIEESIAVLERWRAHGRHRTFVLISAETGVGPGSMMRRYNSPSVSWVGDDAKDGRTEGDTIQEALDKAASAVEGE